MTIPTSFPSTSSTPATMDPDVSSQPKKTTKETHPHLPPGLILDENGKVCKVCNSWADMSKVRKKKVPQGSVSESNKQGGGGDGQGKKNVALGGMGGFAAMLSNTSSNSNAQSSSSSTITTTKAPEGIPLDRSNCPADNEQLGRSTWTFLHTTAAYYPQTPSPSQQTQMKNLLESLSLLYPCNWCSKDFQKDIKKNPPILESREGLMRWLCERHNQVNIKLNKPVFDCGIKELDVRWKDGPDDGSCD